MTFAPTTLEVIAAFYSTISCRLLDGGGTALPLPPRSIAPHRFWDLFVITSWLLCVGVFKGCLQSKWPHKLHFPKLGTQILREPPVPLCGWLVPPQSADHNLHVVNSVHQLQLLNTHGNELLQGYVTSCFNYIKLLIDILFVVFPIKSIWHTDNELGLLTSRFCACHSLIWNH